MNKKAEKTHYRKAFNSPYLSSADIVEPTTLTISHVVLKGDETKKTKDKFNTAYFTEKELRKGEPLKPMILNAVNSKTMKEITGSHFLEDWVNVKVIIFVDHNVRFGRETVEGLRISNKRPSKQKPTITPETSEMWERAKAAYKRDGNLGNVAKHALISKEHTDKLIAEVEAEQDEAI
jgi:hypothetical protein